MVRRGPPDAGAVDQNAEGAELLGRLDGRDDLVGVGHVGGGEDTAHLLGELLARRPVYVEHDHPDASLSEQAHRRLPQPGGSPGHDG